MVNVNGSFFIFPVHLDQSELAQAKIKGLSHNNGTPEPPPRPTKDVNLYQNNQVKVFGTKEKVPIEIKSNILKARADEERHSGKCMRRCMLLFFLHDRDKCLLMLNNQVVAPKLFKTMHGECFTPVSIELHIFCTKLPHRLRSSINENQGAKLFFITWIGCLWHDYFIKKLLKLFA